MRTLVARPPASSSSVMQRKCACGNSTKDHSEDCEECRRKRSRLQTKLTIGMSGDPLEREAERIAARLLSELPPVRPGIAPLHIGRMVTPPGGGAGEAPPSVAAVLASPGRPMEPLLRRDLEQRFGHDFSNVRIHVGEPADRSARDVSAEAYTVGRNVVFAAGRYAPGTVTGRRLLIHELTHVIQQGGGSDSPPRWGGDAIHRLPEPRMVQRQASEPQKTLVILSLDEIRAEAARERRRRELGQFEAKVCKSVGKHTTQENCPTALKPGTEVQLITPKVGGQWLQIENTGFPGIGPKEPTHILAVFAKEKPQPAPEAKAPPRKESLAVPKKESWQDRAKERLRALSAKTRWQPPKGHPRKRTALAINLLITAKDCYFTDPFDTETADRLLDRLQTKFADVYLTDSNFEKRFGQLSGFARGAARELLHQARSGIKGVIAKIRTGQIRPGEAGGEATWNHHLGGFKAAYEVMEVLTGDLEVGETKGLKALDIATSGKAVAAFLEGVLAGAKRPLSSQDYETLTKKLAGSQIISMLAPPIILSGAAVGIGKDIWETLRGVYELVTEPVEMVKQMTELVGILLFEVEAARVLGEAIGEQHGKELHKLASEDIVTFTFKLGELVGPTVVYTVLSIVTAGAVGEAVMSKRLAEVLEKFPKVRRQIDRIRELLPKKKKAGVPGEPRRPLGDLGEGGPATGKVAKRLPEAHARELGELVKDPKNVRPVTDPELVAKGYDREVTGGKHKYRRKEDGTWCRFSDPDCGFQLDPATEAAVEAAVKPLRRPKARASGARVARDPQIFDTPHGKMLDPGYKGRLPDDPPPGHWLSKFEESQSNLKRMLSGRPPIGPDTHPVELHHRTRGPKSRLDEYTRTDHDALPLHEKDFDSLVDRAQFDKERARHWISRARELLRIPDV